MDYLAGQYDVAIVGAGHAGVEAALAAARLGVRTVLFTLSLDALANMPCNPNIGGTAKGHLVREIDALGGEMAKAADATTIQSRMLNRGKGPAVHSLRAQCDRAMYHLYMKETVERQQGLDVKQAEIVEIRTDPTRRHVTQVVTALGAVYDVKTVIIATGTYLVGKIFVGDYTAMTGPDGLQPSVALSANLKALGLPLRRFKTGTPARVHRNSIDYTKLEVQSGDEPVVPFSFDTVTPPENKAVCYIAYTNEKTHQVIRDNLHRSALYGGAIEGIGPRYCPSIEDKVVRFAHKERHQLFVEPMGLHTEEVYLQGMSSSLPEEVQIALYRTIEGFEHIQMMRNAYAIEYDCIDPTVLEHTLAYKGIGGLFGAGQFNGTSGYEEAAAQGLIAGINAAHQVLGRPPVALPRSGSYIGTLIDDLVTKGCLDPYRMMTSRSEYRLLLRQDNADVRLTPLGHSLGLISDERYARFCREQAEKENEIKRLWALTLHPSPVLNQMLKTVNTPELTNPLKAAELLRRPGVTLEMLHALDNAPPALTPHVAEQVEVEIKYEGYIQKQLAQVAKMAKLENRPLPVPMDYTQVAGLRLEAIDKLNKIQPVNLGQASRISGVSPADISVLLIYLSQKGDG